MLATLLAAALAHGAGFTLPDSGVRAMGRAGAFAAGADDLSAQYHNPAALIRLDGAVQLSAWGAHHAVRFDRADEGDQVFDAATNGDPPFVIPAVGAAWSFGRDDLTVAVGLYTATAATYRMPAQGPQRYALVSSRVLQPKAGPSVAFAPLPGLSLGAGVAWSLLSVDQEVASTAAVLPTDSAAYDVPVHLSVLDPVGLTWNAGVLWEPSAGVAVGASVVPPIAYAATGSLEVDLEDNVFYTGESEMGQIIASPSAVDEDVVLEVRMPLVARVGVALRPEPAWEVEVDAVYEGWSSVERLGPAGVDLEIPTTGGEPIVVDQDVVLPMTLVDAWSVRLGAQWSPRDDLDLRLGVLYESSAVPREYRGVLVVDGPKVGLGAGATWRPVERLDLDLGLLRNQHLPQTLEQSSLTQITLDPFSGALGRGESVGRGELSAASTLFGLSAIWRFAP